MKHQEISTNKQETSKLEPGQPVWVKDPISLSWKPAIMKEHAYEPSSYWIQTIENSNVDVGFSFCLVLIVQLTKFKISETESNFSLITSFHQLT